jgi:hypothetical protein
MHTLWTYLLRVVLTFMAVYLLGSVVNLRGSEIYGLLLVGLVLTAVVPVRARRVRS